MSPLTCAIGPSSVNSDNSSFGDVGLLMGLVAEALPVDPGAYPTLGGMSEPEVRNFCVRHSALHFSKTAGQLAALAEALDHGSELRLEKLQKIAVNSVVNALKLADEAGLSANDIASEIRSKYIVFASAVERK